jgi:phosphomevalonate kinase
VSLTITARAPGKLLVLGEYAVLDGCPAVVAAIDRFATVRMTPGAERSRVLIAAPQLAAQIEVPVDQLPSIAGPLRFVLAVLHQIETGQRRALLGGQQILITTELGDSQGNKPGLGSSAAVTVALAAAVWHRQHGRAAESAAEREQVLCSALAAHAQAQGGRGSGADVAASVHGGLLKFEPCGDLPSIQPLCWPAGLHLLVAWSGASASTPQLIARYRALANGHSLQRQQFVMASRAAVEQFIRHSSSAAPAAADSTLQTLISLVDRAGHTLEAFAAAAQLPIFSEALRQVVSIARAHGAAAKISGAGGGDCGLGVTANVAAAARIRAEWRNAGLLPLDLAIAPQGVSSAAR